MEIFDIIKQLSKNSLSLARNSFRLMRLEMALAKKSLPILAGLLLLLLCFFVSLWVFLIALLVVYLSVQGGSIYLCLFSVLAIHVILIVIVALLMRQQAENIKFSATRRHLKSVLSKSHQK